MSSNGGALGIGTASREVEGDTVHEIEKEERNPSSSDPSVVAEKGELIHVTSREDEEEPILSHEEQFPIDPNAEEETHQFTVRAVFVGCCLGGVIAASNVYLGLKTGWTFGASLFGSTAAHHL